MLHLDKFRRQPKTYSHATELSSRDKIYLLYIILIYPIKQGTGAST